MEVFSTLNQEKKYRNRFLDEIDRQIREVGRNESRQAALLLQHLGDVRRESENLLNDFQDRLFRAIDQCRQVVESIEATHHGVGEVLQQPAIDDLTDALILECILGHARSTGGPKGLLTGNTNDFGQPKVRKQLDDAGVKYFKATTRALDWLGSLPPGATP